MKKDSFNSFKSMPKIAKNAKNMQENDINLQKAFEKILTLAR